MADFPIALNTSSIAFRTADFMRLSNATIATTVCEEASLAIMSDKRSISWSITIGLFAVFTVATNRFRIVRRACF